MNSLDKISGEGSNQHPIPEGLEDETLPLELLEKVLSYLDGRAVQSAVVVSRFWRGASIDTAKRKEFALINGFVEFVVETLDSESYPTQIEKLGSIKSNTKILGSVNLIQVKSSIFELRETIINVLKDLEEDDLKTLETLSQGVAIPQFFENVFDLARAYKKLEAAKAIKEANPRWEKSRNYALHNVAVELAKLGKGDKAIEAAKAIKRIYRQSHCYRDFVFADVAVELAKLGNGDVAIEAADAIESQNYRKGVLCKVHEALKNPEKA